MEIWLDTTDFSLIQKALKMGILHGITTNPSLIARSGYPAEELLNKLLDIQPGPITAQVLAEEANEMVRQAKRLHLDPRVLIKIPTTADGYETLHELAKEGIPTVATVIFHPVQALIAAKLGAQYIAPYISRMEQAGDDAFALLQSMQHLINHYHFKAKILGASIKNVEQLRRCADLGLGAVTLKDETFLELIETNKQTAQSLERFTDEWKAALPNKLFSYAML